MPALFVGGFDVGKTRYAASCGSRTETCANDLITKARSGVSEGTPNFSKDAMTPAARLGSSLHVKGGISGSDDEFIDGTVEGLMQLKVRKLTVGTTAKRTAKIVAG
jgi:hypothetical protein